MSDRSLALGVIGGGIMGEAILSRLFVRNIYAPDRVKVADPNPQRREYLTQEYGVAVTAENAEVTREAEVLLLAVKPQIFDRVAPDLALLPASSLVISILAGTPLSRLQAACGDRAVVRVMPNTPATVGAGISALAPGSQVSPTQLETAKQILAAVGSVVEVSEPLLDAVTGLSGSGPAFAAAFIEALSDGGVAAGLPRAIASQLAIETVLGAATLLKEKQMHPAQLKDSVTSPGGTTIAGMVALEKGGLRSAAIEAVKAAAARSRELGQG